MSGDRIRLEVKERDGASRGSRHTRRLRAEGFVPGVLYGKGTAKPFVVHERALREALTGPSGFHAIVDVVVEGQKTPHHAVLKDFQAHATRGTLMHVDFHEVRLDQPIQASVVVQFVGDSPGARMGGVIQQVSRELNVEALPTAIPEHIEVDLGTLEVGGSVRLEDVPAIDGVTFLDDPHETVLATCTAPRGLEEEVEEEPVEGEEPAAEAAEEPAAGEEPVPEE